VNQKITPAVSLTQAVEDIQTQQDFAAFVQALLGDLRDNPQQWNNRDLPTFLEGLAAWVEDMDGYYQNRQEAIPKQPSWKTLGQILLAARTYE
jgi:hypothetical protein